MQEENKSEVARLMRQIELEYEAARRGLTGYAITAKHEFITARMERIGEHHSALQELIGAQKAIHFLVKVFEGKGTGTEETEQAQGDKGESPASNQEGSVGE